MTTLTRALFWERLDPKSYRNGAKPPEGQCYGLGGRPWPRLQIQLMDDPLQRLGLPSTVVSASHKEGPSARWTECGIPDELLKEVAEMMVERAGELAQLSLSITEEPNRGLQRP